MSTIVFTLKPLSNRQQAMVMFLSFTLPSLSVWFYVGMPFDKVALGLLGASLIGGVLAFFKEIAGGTPPTPTVQKT